MMVLRIALLVQRHGFDAERATLLVALVCGCGRE